MAKQHSARVGGFPTEKRERGKEEGGQGREGGAGEAGGRGGGVATVVYSGILTAYGASFMGVAVSAGHNIYEVYIN